MNTNPRTDLFGKKPRRAPRVMMHVIDAGVDAIEYACQKCGHRDWYMNDRSLSATKRGKPCPNCNEEAKENA